MVPRLPPLPLRGLRTYWLHMVIAVGQPQLLSLWIDNHGLSKQLSCKTPPTQARLYEQPFGEGLPASEPGGVSCTREPRQCPFPLLRYRLVRKKYVRVSEPGHARRLLPGGPVRARTWGSWLCCGAGTTRGLTTCFSCG